MTKAADAVVETLADAGVERVFGVVGTSTLDIADAILGDDRLEFVAAHEEEAAVHMADGYARATGRVGVCLCHVGPGALRQLYGVGTAWKDSIPLVLLTGNEVLRATDMGMREAYHVMDVQAAYAPVTKRTLQLREPQDARAAVARALWLATSERPGPVLLDLPKSSLKEPADDAAPRPVVGDRAPAVRPAADPDDVAAVLASLRGARSPVVFAGAGVHRSDASAALVAFAEGTNVPVLTTDGGRGAIPEDHPLCLGQVARQAGDAVAQEALAQADVILAIGTPFSDVSTFEWRAWSPEAEVVQADISAEVALKGTAASRQVVADARRLLHALRAEAEAAGYRCERSWGEQRAALETERAAYLREGDAKRSGQGVNPWALIEALDEHLPRDAFISVDSGMHGFFGKKLRVLEPRTYIRSAGFGAMGYSFPAMLGAVVGDPSRRAVAIVGDGCLSMCLGEFETASRLGSPVTVVVFNDAKFASQHSHQGRRFDGRVVGTEFGLTDYVQVAEAQGVPGWVVQDDDAAAKAVAEAVASAGPNVIDARLDTAVTPSTWIEGSGDDRIGAPKRPGA